MAFDMSKMSLDDGAMDVYFDPKNYKVNENTAVSDFFYSDQFKNGDKVRYLGGMEGKILLGRDEPQEGEVGVIMKVRTSLGNVTHFAGKLFVFWDSMDKIVPVPHELLENAGEDIDDADMQYDGPISIGPISKQAFYYSSSVEDLRKHFVVKGPTSNPDEAELIHKSSQELWSLEKSGSGFKIQRLFNPNGAPIKEYQTKKTDKKQAPGKSAIRRTKKK
jgi:hypothetical protein